MLRRTFLQGLAVTGLLARLPANAAPVGERLVTAARAQIGVTTSYDPRYASMAYPHGDVPRSTGVCADVVVRAARDAFALDLQQLVHEDMLKDFAAYPQFPGTRHPDSNIDHRRVLNLETYWRRAGCQVWSAGGNIAGDAFGRPLQPGDVLTSLLNARLPHVAVVSAVATSGTQVVHNVGRGAEEIELAAFHLHRAKGQYRWPAA